MYRVERDATFGRHVVAAQDLAPGQLVLQEQAHAAVLYDDCLTTHCHWTLEPCASLKRCGSCKFARYSSREAQRRDFDEGMHREECRALRAFAPRVPPASLRLAAKVLWRRARESAAGRAPPAGDPAGGGQAAAIEALEHHWELLDDARRVLWAQAAVATREYMAGAGEPLPEPREVAMLLARFAVNNHTLCCPELRAYGVGLFPEGALVNHSCTPNAAQVFSGRTIAFRALRPIPQGIQVCIAYTELGQPREMRRTHLLRHYHFDIDPLEAADIRSWLQPYRTEQLPIDPAAQQMAADTLQEFGREVPITTDDADRPLYQLCLGCAPMRMTPTGWQLARVDLLPRSYILGSAPAATDPSPFLQALHGGVVACALALGPAPWWPRQGSVRIGDVQVSCEGQDSASVPLAASGGSGGAGAGAAAHLQVEVLRLRLKQSNPKAVSLTALVAEAWPCDAECLDAPLLRGVTDLLEAHRGAGTVTALHCTGGRSDHCGTLVLVDAVRRHLAHDPYSGAEALVDTTLRELGEAQWGEGDPAWAPPASPQQRAAVLETLRPLAGRRRWGELSPFDAIPDMHPRSAPFGTVEVQQPEAAEPLVASFAGLELAGGVGSSTPQLGAGYSAARSISDPEQPCTVLLWGRSGLKVEEAACQLLKGVRAAEAAQRHAKDGRTAEAARAAEAALEALPSLAPHHWVRQALLHVLARAALALEDWPLALAAHRALQPFYARLHPANHPCLLLQTLTLARLEDLCGSPRWARHAALSAIRSVRLLYPDDARAWELAASIGHLVQDSDADLEAEALAS